MSASADETMDVRLVDGSVYAFMGFLIVPPPNSTNVEARLTVFLCPGCCALTPSPAVHHNQAHGVNLQDSREARRGIQIGDNNTQTNTF
jgi:hypothetical protein